MNQHYYTPRPDTPHDIRTHRFRVRGLDLCFRTDSGVFSKGGLDEGTRILIENLPPLTGRVLDMGCGWGGLGIPMALLNPQASFLLTDINERAAGLARENAKANGAGNVQVVTGDGFAAVEGFFQYILSNPPIRAGKAFLYPLFEEALKRLEPGGSLFLVIRKQQGADSALKFLSGLSEARYIAKKKGYRILRCDPLQGEEGQMP